MFQKGDISTLSFVVDISSVGLNVAKRISQELLKRTKITELHLASCLLDL